MAHDRIVSFGTNLSGLGSYGSQSWGGGEATFAVWGNFGTGAAKLQWSPDNITWIDVPLANFTTSNFTTVILGVGYVQLAITALATGISAQLNPTNR